MGVYRVEDNGQEPAFWKVEKFANVPYEDWVKQILDLRVLVDAGEIYGKEAEDLKEAITAILVEGLMPAHVEIKEIRKLATSDKPILERWQPYENLARKIWKAYKELTQTAARLAGFDIGFLFQDDVKFSKGLIAFRQANPALNKNFEKVLESARSNWQNDLSKFRNSILEHQGGDRKDFDWFYKPENAEALFNRVWRTIADILPMLLELRLGDGTRLIEQDPNDPGPRWPQRFRYHIPGLNAPS